MNAAIRAAVRERAANACEYCGVEQVHLPTVTLHVEHVIARQHLGEDALSNLALACSWCNSHKGPNLSGIDPVTQDLVSLYNPRNENWNDHFEMEGAVVVGLTAVGRATIQVLQMNSAGQVLQRARIQRAQ